MFKEGDSVYIKDSAQVDIGGVAWNYIKEHRNAVIVCTSQDATKLMPPLDEAETTYVVVWFEPFKGGWTCWDQCLPGHGQIVTQKHLELNFEVSREAVTVPNIELPPDRTRS